MKRLVRGVGARALVLTLSAVVLAAVAGGLASPAYADTGQFTICKVAGSGVAGGTDFTFTVNGQTTVTVAAGSCVIVGQFDLGTNVSVAETITDGIEVASITVGADGILASSKPAAGTAVVTIAGFHNTVTYTNQAVVHRPMAVSMVSSSATATRRGVLVRWRTGVETDTLGFDVFRELNHQRTRINRALIPSILGGTSGHAYAFVDRKAPNSRGVRYWIRATATNGSRSWLGPIALR
jgi:hypothetical protein